MRALTLLGLLVLASLTTACTPDNTPEGTDCVQSGRRGSIVTCY
jgi:hypothetical protein